MAVPLSLFFLVFLLLVGVPFWVSLGLGTVAMLSLPRDLYVYLLNGRMDRVNTVFAWGNSMNWDGGTFFYVRQVLLYNLGINVHYYALVDLSGFTEAIDLLGTVEVGVDCPIIDYQLVGAEVPKGATKINEDGEYILPIGYYELTGKEALWYARSRDVPRAAP